MRVGGQCGGGVEAMGSFSAFHPAGQSRSSAARGREPHESELRHLTGDPIARTASSGASRGPLLQPGYTLCADRVRAD